VVIHLRQDADLHIAQLMPLPLTVSCSSKSGLVLPFWYRLTRVVPDKGPLNRCCCCYDIDGVFLFQLGLPLSCVCTVPCHMTHMDVTVLQKLIEDDVSSGKTPTIVFAYAGQSCQHGFMYLCCPYHCLLGM